jgi:hypothetical protein
VLENPYYQSVSKVSCGAAFFANLFRPAATFLTSTRMNKKSVIYGSIQRGEECGEIFDSCDNLRGALSSVGANGVKLKWRWCFGLGKKKIAAYKNFIYDVGITVEGSERVLGC